MTISETPLFLENLEPYASPEFWEAHKRLADSPLSEIVQNMPPILSTGDQDRTVGYMELSGKDCDDNSAVIVNFPFSLGRDPRMIIRMTLLRSVLSPESRMIMFPSNTVEDRRVCNLNNNERRKVAGGDFTPVVDKQLRTLEALNVENGQIFGYSKGATEGAALAGYISTKNAFELRDSGFIDPPNVKERSMFRLIKDSAASGIPDQSINDSAIPALSEALFSNGGLDRIRRLPPMWSFFRSANLPENRSIRRGMRFDSFSKDILKILNNTDAKVALVRADKSAIVPTDSPSFVLLQGIAEDNSNLKILSVPGEHGFANNVALHALIGRVALYKE